MLGRETALMSETDGGRFVSTIGAEFETPDAVLLAIEAGGRSFGVPVRRHAAVNADLAGCRQDP